MERVSESHADPRPLGGACLDHPLPGPGNKEDSERAWKVVPDLSPNLLVHRTRRGTSFRLVGPRTRATDIDVRDRLWSVGVRFRPGVLPALVRADAQELTNASCDPSPFWGPQDELCDSLRRAPSASVAASALVKFLEGLPGSKTPTGGPHSGGNALRPRSGNRGLARAQARRQPPHTPIGFTSGAGHDSENGSPHPTPLWRPAGCLIQGRRSLVAYRPGRGLLRRRTPEPRVPHTHE